MSTGRRISRSDITLPPVLKNKLQLVSSSSWTQLLRNRNYNVIEDDHTSFADNIVLIVDASDNHFIMKSEAILSHEDWNDRCYRELLIYRALSLQFLWKSSPHFINLLDWWKSYGGPETHDDVKLKIPKNLKKLKSNNYMNLVLEKADISLLKFLQKRDYLLSPFLYKSIVFQLLFALYRAQNDCQFVHNDLHMNNILLTNIQDATKYCYHVEDSTFHPGRFGKDDENSYLIKITDFGNARAKLFDTGEIVYNTSLDQHSQFNAALDITKIMKELKSVKIDWDQLPTEEAQTQKFLYQKLRSEADKIGVTPKKLLRSLFFKSFKVNDAFNEDSGSISSEMIHFGDFMQPNPYPTNNFDSIGGNHDGEYVPQEISLTPIKSSEERIDTYHWKRIGKVLLKNYDFRIGSVSVYHSGEIGCKVRSLNICKVLPLQFFDKIPLKHIEFVCLQPISEKTKENLENVFKSLESNQVIGTTDSMDFNGYAFCLLPRYSKLSRKYNIKYEQFPGVYLYFQDPNELNTEIDISNNSLNLSTDSQFSTSLPASQDQSFVSNGEVLNEIQQINDFGTSSNTNSWILEQNANKQRNQPYFQEIHSYQTNLKPYNGSELYLPKIASNLQDNIKYSSYISTYRSISPNSTSRDFHNSSNSEQYGEHNHFVKNETQIIENEKFRDQYKLDYKYSNRDIDKHELFSDRTKDSYREERTDKYNEYVEAHKKRDFYKHSDNKSDRLSYVYKEPSRSFRESSRNHRESSRDFKRTTYDRYERERSDSSYTSRNKFSDDHYKEYKRVRLDDDYHINKDSFYSKNLSISSNPRSYSSNELDKKFSSNDDYKNKSDKRKGDSKRPRKPTNTLWINLKQYQEIYPNHTHEDCYETLRKDFGKETLISLPKVEEGIPNYTIVNFSTVNEAKDAYEFIEKHKLNLYPNFRYTYPTKKQSMGQ